MSGNGLPLNSSHLPRNDRVELEIVYTSGKATKIQQVMAQTIPTTEIMSDTLPSWRALFGELETVHCAITAVHTHARTHIIIITLVFSLL